MPLVGIVWGEVVVKLNVVAVVLYCEPSPGLKFPITGGAGGTVPVMA